MVVSSSPGTNKDDVGATRALDTKQSSEPAPQVCRRPSAVYTQQERHGYGAHEHQEPSSKARRCGPPRRRRPRPTEAETKRIEPRQRAAERVDAFQNAKGGGGETGRCVTITSIQKRAK